MSEDAQPGQIGPENTTNRYNSTAAQIKLWAQQNISTMKPVKVVKVYNSDGDEVTENKTPSPIGYVDVQPVVRQMNAQGDTQDHGIIPRVPYVRSTGGKVAIIMDPKEGDIGMLVCADRDMSAVKANRGDMSQPGSFRTFDPADGVFVGSFTGPDAPEAYIYWKGDDHWLITPDKGKTYITIRPGEIEIWADKVALHGVSVASIDAGGTGIEYRPSQIDDYTQGVPKNNHSPHPPAVPNAEDLEEQQ